MPLPGYRTLGRCRKEETVERYVKTVIYTLPSYVSTSSLAHQLPVNSLLHQTSPATLQPEVQDVEHKLLSKTLSGKDRQSFCATCARMRARALLLLHVIIHNVAWERTGPRGGQKDVQTSDVAMYIQDTCQYFTITEENIFVCPSYQQVLRRPLPRPRLFGILLLPGQSFLREQWQYGEGLGSSVQCRHGGGGGCE